MIARHRHGHAHRIQKLDHVGTLRDARKFRRRDSVPAKRDHGRSRRRLNLSIQERLQCRESTHALGIGAVRVGIVEV